MEFNTDWNVIPEDDFKKATRLVFDQVSESLTKTLGPYGTTTIVEKFGEHHVTKDGFNVLKSINYKDPVLNNILMLLFRISAQVVFQVGDGSTSAIVSANEIIKEFNENDEFINSYRPKQLMDGISECVDTIVDRIYKSAKRIDIDVNGSDDYNKIHQIAKISTNGEDAIADMIVDIYKQTQNPTIELVESKTDETSYEIIDGYIANTTYLDTIYATRDDGICAITNGANILMFDHKIDMDALPLISAAAQKSATENCRLVVIAPIYDKILLDHIRRQVNIEYQSRGTTTCVYCKTSLINNMSHIMYNDFAVLCGAQVINERYGDDAVKPEEINEYIGYIQSVEIGPKTTLIKGFVKRNDEMYNKICLDAQIKFNELAEKYQNMGIVDTALTEAKNRMTKLRCSMGIIRVGGKSTLERKALYDLVEDAVRACESAYRYGYNIGGNLAIVYAISDIKRDTTSDTFKNDIYDIIQRAFINVFKTVLRNKYRNDDEPNNIVNDILAKYNETGEPIGYDLATDEISTEIINSCRTDIEILRGALSVISLLITSNQYISITTHDHK